MFDLTIFPISLTAGRELHELPGLFVSAAPRKAARLRAQDQLLLYATFVRTAGGNSGSPSSALTPAQQQEILSHLSETYFSFSGSVTAGLRAVVARLNDFLLSRNLKSAQEGQTIALLNMAVVHGETLIIAHAGPTHSFVLQRVQVEHFDDSPSAAAPGAGRGLGLSRQPTVRFYQSTLQSGDLLVMSAEPPTAWTIRSLANSAQLPFEHLRRRLLSDAGVDLQTAVVRFQSGKGQISYWRPGQQARGSDAARGAESSHGPVRRPAARGEQPPSRPMAHPAADAVPLPKTPPPAEPAAASEVTTPADGNDVDVPPALPSARTDASAAPSNPPSAEPVEPTPPAPFASQTSETSPEVESTSSQDPARSALNPPETRSLPEEPTVPSQREQLPQRQYEQPIRRARPAHEPHAPAASTASSAANAAPAASGADRSLPRRRTAPGKSVVRPKRTGPPAGEKLRQNLASGLRRWTTSRAAMRGALARSVGRILPTRLDEQGRPQPLFNLSSAWMLAVAVIIPLVVVTIATTVYFRAGRSEQFGVILGQAQNAAQQAGKQKDPIIQRQYWARTYELVGKAEAYGQSEASRSLKQQALAALDASDGIVRLSYQPAVSGDFPLDVKITRVVATLNDVYLLDSSQGRILRLYRTASGYEVDPKFTCGPGKAGALQVGPLLDIVALPPNNQMRSTVMGLDAGGNVVYCSPSLASFDSRPLALPDAGWGKIVGMTLYNDSLYVLDPKGNAVYRYDGNNGIFEQPPHLYFDTSIPQMNDVVDIAVDQEFVYLLHADGKMTRCESGQFALSSTKCDDPAPYGDTRAGFDPAPLAFAGTRFTQIQTTEPPDPSLFALDEVNKSVYHLSLRRLNFQRQYRSQPGADFPLPAGTPTAFAVAPNRRILIAFGNRLFFAAMP